MSDRKTLGELRERAVREELNHLLDSTVFRTSKRCRQFLTYIVERTIDGQPVTLKERSIGVDLFQLPHDFDTGQHTIVRVTATEVRKKLAQHYLAENGSHHSVRIDLPPGAYSVDFKWAAPPQELPTPKEAFEANWPPSALPPQTERRDAIKSKLPWRVPAAIVVFCLLLGVFFVWRHRQQSLEISYPKSVAFRDAPAASPSSSETVRILAGSGETYMDRSGHKWGADRFFTGGAVVVRSAEKIVRTLNPDIYRHLRQGDFRYDIPLPPGSYELHLHFAETGLSDFISAESSGEGQRVFRVYANGRNLLDLFDVVADAAGSNISDERVFKEVSPAADGFLHLNFISVRGAAMVSGIELTPLTAKTVRPVLIRAGWSAPWEDSTGRHWDADGYFLGGNALVRSTNPVQKGNALPLYSALYASERWGHFSYAVPVAKGRYKVTLRFSEGHYGHGNTGVGGLGSRVFDVFCNGSALLRNFDIYKEAQGEGKPLAISFPGIEPNAQGKIILSFVPIRGMACVNGIEVVDDLR